MPHARRPAYGEVLGLLPEWRKLAAEAGRDPASVPITVFGVAEDLDLIRRYRDAGVARLVFNLPAAKADEVLPVLDRCAGLDRAGGRLSGWRHRRARPSSAGSIAPDDAWLAKAPPEPILEPDLPIIDTHHHLWHRGGHRYFIQEFLDDVRTGHNTVATVFMECHSMYRANGQEEMRPVGEAEFVAGQAAMSDSGIYGPTRVALGFVGFADLTLGDRVEPVLEALTRASGGRFRGVRHSAAWDAEPGDRQQRVGQGTPPDGAERLSRGPPPAGQARLLP